MIPFKPSSPAAAPLPAKRTIDLSKPKVRKDGTPAPDCIKCKEKKR